MDRATRAASHAALGDERRLRIVDRLAMGDCTFAELAEIGDLSGNLLAHHLATLETAGLIQRRVSEGDRRRRYISLNWEALPGTPTASLGPDPTVAFVCTHNSARSQFAAAFWQRSTGRPAPSAGSAPAGQVHPTAVLVAEEFETDLSSAIPAGYETLPEVDLIVSVCDRANEGGLPRSARHLHWSIPDPVSSGEPDAFRSAFTDIAHRIERMTIASQPSTT